MSNDQAGGRTRVTDRRLPDIDDARAQFEAARLRHERLVESRRLPGPMPGGSLPKTVLPGYQLQRELHRGGQGVVYVGLQESTGRQVAIKLLRCRPWGPDSTSLARFQREVEILSRLRHPNIVTIHDCGRDREDVYLVMDYVHGTPLDAHVRQSQTSLRETLALVARVCDAVHAAHLRGVIHRDLKPANILVDEHGEPRVLDFGLAKLVDDSSSAADARVMTATGEFVGSLPWASPEQAAGRLDALDIRTDVYSLGVILYQLTTGRFPYPVAGRIDEVVRHIAQSEPVRPTTLRRGVDRELETILLKSLAKEPERRYQSAAELARDIRRHLAGEPIEARRDSLAYMMRKRLARYRAAVIAASAVLLVILAALVVSVASRRQAERQRTLAQESAERADREADQARAVVAFMRDVLTGVESEKRGADARLVDVLADASKAASQRFAAHPQQEAQVRELLGEVYLELSSWAESEAELAAALALWRQHAGPDDPRTLRAESTCAGVALNRSKYREAEAALVELLPRMTRVLGADHRETLAARRSLAIAMLAQGRIDEAEPILLELRSHPALADDDAMQLRIALTLIDVLQWRRSFLSDGPERDESLARERALADEWIERSVRLYGPEASITLQGRAIRAGITRDQARFADAVAQCRELLEESAERLPDCHDVRAYAMAVLATSLGYQGEDDEPADLYLRRIECIRAHGEAARLALMSALADALPYLERAGRAVEGEPLAREFSVQMRRFGGDTAFEAELYIARFVSMQRRFDEADELFQALMDRAGELSHAHVRARLHLFLGQHLALQGRFDEAEQSLRSAAECLDDVRSGTRPTHPDDLLAAFLELYDAWGRPEPARGYARLREEALARVRGPEALGDSARE
ncbi:MAG: serine/threonine protein kinase [Phycisphaerae bacterium]|jgi:hypothetical protein